MPDKNNLSIWEKVCETDPNNTKPVTLGRSFTAIDPYSQIYEATKVFGPAGKDWGWESVRVEYTPTNEVAILVRVWHGKPEQYIEQWGQAGLYIDRAEKKKDTDCFKKAQTDAITKCLSYLGFNADVFLGKFDDNKYVVEMNHKFAVKNEPVPPQADINRIEDIKKKYEKIETLEQLKDFGKLDAEFVGKLEDKYPSRANDLRVAYASARDRLTIESTPTT